MDKTQAAADRDAEDLDLLERWRGGDERAGTKLFDRHAASLVRFFRNKLATGIEDLVQDTMLACVRGRDRIREGSHFRAYMFSSARNLLYRHLRDRSRSTTVNIDDLVLADVEPGVSTDYAKRREQRLLLEALRRLPLMYQVTLELYYWEGLSGPELADALAIPEPTARARVRRGSQQLREMVEKLADSPALVQSTVDGLQEWLADLRQAAAASS